MSQDRNPYYDSARDKPDRSEFASLRAGLETRSRPAPAAGGPWLKIALGVGLLLAALVLGHYLA